MPSDWLSMSEFDFRWTLRLRLLLPLAIDVEPFVDVFPRCFGDQRAIHEPLAKSILRLLDPPPTTLRTFQR